MPDAAKEIQHDVPHDIENTTSTAVSTSLIRGHYNLLSPLYRLFWGEHIHHGYWANDVTLSPAQAQVALIELLAERTGVPHGARVLDVGCGLGGSSVWLATRRQCSVLGITISPHQVKLATRRAKAAGVEERAQFQEHDANDLHMPSESFDVVWVIECSEHLYDKAAFIADCHRLLRPGGKLALCAWVAGQHASAEQRHLQAKICQSMLCPSLAGMREYADWMKAAGFQDIQAEDISASVRHTWTCCLRIAKKPIVRLLLPFTGRRTRRFVESFACMQRAYELRALAYGMMTATKMGRQYSS